MDKIYIIKYYNGEDYEESAIFDWTFCETEEEAKKLAAELTDQLAKDIERYRFLISHRDLIYNKEGNYSNSETSLEFQQLECKYPYSWMNSENIYNAGFIIREVTKR